MSAYPQLFCLFELVGDGVACLYAEGVASEDDLLDGVDVETREMGLDVRARFELECLAQERENAWI